MERRRIACRAEGELCVVYIDTDINTGDMRENKEQRARTRFDMAARVHTSVLLL